MEHGGKGFSILTYNLYLMFDDVDDGDEYHPFTSSNGYGPEAYKKRIGGYASLLVSDGYLSDVFVFQEVESEKVLEDLIKAGLAKYGFKYYGIINNDNPISVGFISRIMPNRIFLHESDGPRPILELEFIISGEMVSVFVLHAKSRLDDGAGQRRSQFEHLDFLLRSSSPSLSLACGDFNEDPRYGFAMADPAYVPDPALCVTGDPELASSFVYYSAALDPDMPAMDTYHFEGRWYSYDHVLVNGAAFDGSGLELLDVRVLCPGVVVDPSGIPLRYEPGSNHGFSDHLAVRAVFGYH